LNSILTLYLWLKSTKPSEALAREALERKMRRKAFTPKKKEQRSAEVYRGMDEFPGNPSNPPLSKGGQGGFLKFVSNLGTT
jgi:hypothetical protein